MTNDKVQFTRALKTIARNEQMKSYIQQSNELYPLLLKAAKRFVIGEHRQEAIATAKELITKGYLISLDYIGENTIDLKECQKAKNEYLHLMEEMSSLSMQQTVSLDLSHIGLSFDAETAHLHLLEIAKAAKLNKMTVMIGMEESSKTDEILTIYKKATSQYDNIGITIQTHLLRSNNDIQNLVDLPGRIRIVKGAYQESSKDAIPRSNELNNRYLHFVEQLIEANHPVSVATHDETLIKEMEQRGYFRHPNLEIEMLYGIRPDLLKALKSKGYNCKIYLPYGKDWYLYLCHRIAEHPENLYRAITEIIVPALTERSKAY
ncbi:proline dehydrogenase family protein [Metabacillus niabensis]|uniref:proline dehydrogenase n=1 Tax=Metabacillus niabensis TaxID=324854 RepID=A0ABT9Z4U3_9BACI|nr:proline dehydrogenase family protein [Metabacillus niabensis]MDQ0226593.1 proline dehydrogenase [Metabacillus niabensis]